MKEIKQSSKYNDEEGSINYEKALNHLISNLISKHKLTKEEIIELSKDPDNIKIPLNLFKSKLSPLELVVRYLKQEKNLKFSEIGRLINRDERTIWGAYTKSKEKLKTQLTIKSSEINIPISVFSNREFSILESLVAYLKEKHNLTFHKIGELINRNERTVWTCYSRLNKKRGKK